MQCTYLLPIEGYFMRNYLKIAPIFFTLNLMAAEIPSHDKPNIILGNVKTMSNINELSQFSQYEMELKPWSASYWGYLHGNLGLRYRDPEMAQMVEEHFNFKSLQKFALKEKTMSSYLYNQTNINQLSPSEKYDLLIGNTEDGLTKSVWEDGNKMMSRRLGIGNIPLWRGICHGLAPASAILPRPVKAVTLTAKNSNQNITFYPEDIKALGSLLYAKGNTQVNFLGKRCGKMGASRSNQCIGINPGSLHQLLINRLAIQNKHLVLDMSRGSEVWNYPVQAYKMTYFNVLNSSETEDLNAATVKLYQIPEKSDLRKFRAEKTHSIVGVKLTLESPEMTPPSLLDTDAPENDVLKTHEFVYDLEIDARGNIIGGEYHSYERPDFAWFPKENSSALANGESKNLKWDGSKVDNKIASLAGKAAKDSQPLAVIVNKLFELAQ
jgi:hypothetical protein